MSSELTLAQEMYRTWKKNKVRRRVKSTLPARGGSRPYDTGSGRDPLLLGTVVTDAVNVNGWSVQLENWRVIESWAQIVGENISARTSVKDFENGVLKVECDSTAWATQLRTMRSEIINKIGEQFPVSDIEDIQFYVTGIPTWRHGPRVVKGQGPRDTYK